MHTNLAPTHVHGTYAEVAVVVKHTPTTHANIFCIHIDSELHAYVIMYHGSCIHISYICTFKVLDFAATKMATAVLHWGALRLLVRESNLASLFFQCSSSARGPTVSASLLICSDSVRIYEHIRRNIQIMYNNNNL